MTSNDEMLLSIVLCSMFTGFNRQMLKLQRQLKNYKGTLMGKKLLKKGELKKCTRKGGLKNCTLFVVSAISERLQYLLM